MRTVEDECVGCPKEMGCLGSSCPNRNVIRYYCDYCEEEYFPEELYKYNGDEICRDCLCEQFETCEN